VSPAHLDKRAFEAICNRVSKRLVYAAKIQRERFVSLEKLEQEPSSKSSTFHISEILEQLSLEEQSYVLMKMEGFTLQEIASHLKIPISTVHDHWRKLIRKLKVLMK
ncbi:MAG TPA: LuxR C-terminal-related transcriptional regulator, partial [Chthoniobacteraceae bacterium]|nr:LuxR C-terminal-related transcriptional regulator [Chthoniobacteraceae bacterium]